MSSQPPEPSSSPLRTVGLLVTGSATVLTPLVYWSSSNLLDAAVAAVVAVLGALFLFMLRRGRTRYAVHFLVYGVMTASSMELLAFGSVRAAGGFMMVAAVAGAGIFLGRKPLIGAVIYGVVSLGVLTAAEQRGWLIEPNHEVGLKVWLTHSAVLVVVAIMVFYSRTKAQVALELQQAELERRIRSEQERDQSLERFTRIFRNSPSPMIAQSARNGLILDVNPAFERCYGRTREDVLGCTDEMLWAEPEQRTRYLEQLFTHRRADRTHVKGLRADGSHFDALISSEMGDDPQDRLVITIVTDITEQNTTIERLRRSEERFAKAFNFSPMNLSITRLSDGLILEVNRAGVISDGMGVDVLRGRTTLETGAWLTPAHRQAYIDRLKRDGRVLAYESQMRSRDGKPVDVRLWAVLIDIEGEECILSSTVNVSEEKRREALLLSVAQGMTGETGEAFFTALARHAAPALKADLVMVSERLSEQQVQTLAASKDGALMPNFVFDPQGTPCGEALVNSGLCVYEQGMAHAYPAMSSVTGVPASAYIGQSLRDQDGTAIGLLSAMWRQPITLTAEMRALMSIFASRATAELMRLRREREIQQLNATLEQRVQSRTAELQKLNAELDSFAYSVSHDLKSPLRAIDGFTSLLSEQLHGRLSVDEEQLLDRVLVSTHRMSTLIADLLALARVSQGEMTPGMANLSEIAEQVMKAEQAKHPDRPLAWRIEPGLVSVCDARLARIALENLLGNAVKYTRNQSQPLIEMGRYRDGDPARTTFFVRDNGVGFNMAYAEKLFKPFQRLHGPSEFEGTGIGLATVRRIVDRHGGHIQGVGRPGEGAEFRFSLTPATVSR
ncbi:PAS domain-containing sensor histidine kinase [Hydrogenophaga pseudoflava]|uniref:PAS domain-containing sensor histidine kinase n=1 Tax=Hydrogenophaga pseudoflava TaxID=47421 RepID=UPI0027E58774|nr:PAS domain S-box protein [Hydrogenophaga pseudoflava]MDQ7743983.1 PAS domain S-box protein [Hydrogenophaga pseudoflava]